MKTLLVGLAFLISACSAVPSDFYESSVELGYKTRTICTASHIGGGKFLTAGHCVATAVASSTPIYIEGVQAEILFAEYVYDVAVLSVPSLADKIKSSRLRCVTPSIGQKVIVVGEPKGNDDIHTYGKVASTVRNIENRWREAMYVNITAAHGSSGSPVYNKQNEVIGILVGGILPWGGMSIIVPGSTVCKVAKDVL